VLVLRFVGGLGSLQATLLLLLIGLRYRHPRNLPLALLLLVFSIRLGTIATWNPAMLLESPWLLPAFAPLPFLFGPLLWLYVREIARAGQIPPTDADAVAGAQARARLSLLHLLPYGIGVTVLTLAVLILRPQAYTAFVGDLFRGRAPWWFNLQNWAKVIVNVLYVGLAVRLAYLRPIHAIASGRRLWLRSLSLAPIPSLALYSYVAVNPQASAALAEGSNLPFALLAAAMALLVYALSMLVLVSPEVPRGDADLFSVSRMSISDEECDEIAETVRAELEAGGYRDPELSLTGLAAKLGVHPNRLSVSVNRIYELSFPCLVNSYRIEYFLSRVDRGALESQSILDLAFDAGFASKSTFNRVFKDFVGVAPSRYRPGDGPRKTPRGRLPHCKPR